MKTKIAYLHSIYYQLGELTDIANIDILDKDPSKLLRYKKEGLSKFSSSKKPILELLESSIQGCLQKSKIDPVTVDIILIATETLPSTDSYVIKGINQILVKTGLTKTYPIRVGLSGCCNYSIALELAMNILFSNRAKRILLVTADIAKDNNLGRFFIPDIGIISDSSACCIVDSNCNSNCFAVTHIEHHSDPILWSLDTESTLALFILRMIKSITRLTKKILNITAMSSSEFKFIITNNYTRPVMTMFAKSAGFAESQIFFDNLQRFAHANAADTFIAISDIQETYYQEKDYDLLILTTSPSTVGVFALHHVV